MVTPWMCSRNGEPWFESSIGALTGETIVAAAGLYRGSESVSFATESGRSFVMHHHEDCCESVQIEDVTGDVGDILGRRLVLAESVSQSDDPESEWTFYKLGTSAGYLTIRWLGQSNGYYAMGVNVCERKGDE